MRLTQCVAAAVVGLAAPLAAGAAGAHHRAAPRLSYLRYNSYSVSEVLGQLNGSVKLRQRYANHFHIAPEQVIPYFRANLVESYVPRTRRYRVWMSTKDGHKFARYQTFHAGTRVLALRNGEPVLKWACGNPLTNRLPSIQKRKKVVPRTSKVLPKVQQRTRYVNVETPWEKPVEEFPVVTLLNEAPPSRLWLKSTSVAVAVPGRMPWAPLTLALGVPKWRHTDHFYPEVPESPTALLGLLGLAAAGVFTRKRVR
ncbi:MAG TPA: hypothetical protein VGM37_16775 [Armatimonadota bacterium]|jgi:hypothetical protein